ncbi:rootletin-like [Aricia agestis]|uniref:rootletin-like n=1 Tax=Aricia agestis TaxID=91739 RepID=UPI001C202D71|nr:rootletin-like [Aricia agestis]
MRVEGAAAAASVGESATTRESPKPAHLTAPAADAITDEDVDFSVYQPNGVERVKRLAQRRKERGCPIRDLPNLPPVLQWRDVHGTQPRAPTPTGHDEEVGRGLTRSPRVILRDVMREFSIPPPQGRDNTTGRDNEDWPADSDDTASDVSMDSEGLPTIPARTHLKRRNSDDDMEPPISKGAVPKAKKGRGRPPTTGQYVGFGKAQAELNKEKEEERRAAFRAKVEEVARRAREEREAREARAALRASPAPAEDTEETGAALAASVERALDMVTMVATRSSNLKGTYQRALKEAVASIKAAVNEMRGRGQTEEMRALEAQNDRLLRQVNAMRRELEELRRRVTGPATDDLQRMLSEVSRSNIETFGNMLNARIAGLEDRLLPEPRRRPPLAADGAGTSAGAQPTAAAKKTPKPKKAATAKAPDKTLRRSDDDMAPPLSKGAVPKPKRGCGRPPTTGQYVGLAKAQADLNREKEEALRLQAEEEVAEAARAARETRSSLLASPAAMEEDSEVILEEVRNDSRKDRREGGKLAKVPSRSTARAGITLEEILGTESIPSMSESELVATKRLFSELSGSDTEGAGAGSDKTVKPQVAKRGKSRGSTSRLSAARQELRERTKEAKEADFLGSLDGRSFRKEVTELAESPPPGPLDIDVEAMGPEDLLQAAEKNLQEIVGIANKSSNLKGGYANKIRRATSAVRLVLDALGARTEAEETRRLKADNNRLQRELANLREEVRAYKREFEESRTEAAKEKRSPMSSEQLGVLERNVARLVGNLVDKRLAALEERLPPLAPIRPPLAADRKRAAAQEKGAAHVASPAPVVLPNQDFSPVVSTPVTRRVEREEFPALPVRPEVRSAPPPKKVKGKAKGSKSQERTEAGSSASASAVTTSSGVPIDASASIAVTANPAEESSAGWTEVVRRKAPKKKEPIAKPVKKAPKVVMPRSTAVVVKLKLDFVLTLKSRACLMLRRWTL